MSIQNLPLAEKTNIKNWAFEALALTDVTAPSVDLSALHVTDNAVVIVDGHVVHNQVDANLTIETTVSAHANENKLLVLNNEKKNSTLKVTVPKNVTIETPLSIIVIAKERSLVHASEVILETGAALNYTESFIGQGNFNANIASTFNVGENANLVTNTINELYPGTVVYHHKHADVDANGVLDATNFMINDTDLVFEDFTYLNGRGSEAETKTVSIASEGQKQNLTIRIENAAARSIGNIINYGITKDTAHLAFNGVGKIQKNAKDCDNQQETRLLNLSKTAEAVANPFLLIDEGDITAGHAASIGQLDEEQIYYLMSRGMSREAASKMIVSGFLTPFVDALEDEAMREALSARIEAKLG
ncbi:MAG: SufD family Fe-S cluster assembly protein [Defluviitaleaceae bacterium]|nr:SufD family Fe-S cluster assembly protein [Defluviitaleaceae bacterium]